MRNRIQNNPKRRGFTLIEVLIAMVVGTILIMGMGMVLVVLFKGMNESKDFSEATGRVDLVRQLTFDARTGNAIAFPATDGATGDYTFGGNEGDQVQFNSLSYDVGTDTTSDITVTWESRRPAGSPIGTEYTVYRFIDTTPESPTNNPADDVQTFGQNHIIDFDIVRNSSDSFQATFSSKEGTETVAVELAVTLRNVID
ncbi:MAG: prepilin-type N-terminal cleavage/methylation domain-containing protein [Planctomycetes bacterium]|nr:prepilin-type N-terminal cleavage/methylation domain-containing protein [Planctomycetota bacterium]